MTKPFSPAYKNKMVERMTGRDAASAREMSRETGLSQETLSRWLRDAHNLPLMPSHKKQQKKRSVEDKALVLTETAKLTGSELGEYLERRGLRLADLEQWRMALGDEGGAAIAITKRIRNLERELARKEKALAEAATLLILKKKVEHLWEEEDEDTDEKNGV